jgi:glucose-1-phosphate adenylyltransferase
VGRRRVMAYPFAEHWEDIGTMEAFFEANISLAQPRPPFRLYKPGWPIYTRTRSLPPSRIIRSEIRDSLVVEGSDINGAVISDSIVGVRSSIREGSRLDHVVMHGSDFFEGEVEGMRRYSGGKDVPPLGIGRHCAIERTIIDKNARIGDGVVIRPQPREREVCEDHFWIRDGITIIQRGAVIPSGTEI